MAPHAPTCEPVAAARDFEVLLLDMDDCLYPQASGLDLHCKRLIEEYMHKELGIPAEDVADVCYRAYIEHGTTLAGLVSQGHRIDYDKWHAAVHAPMPYEECLRPDPALREMLESLKQRKFVFTNGDRAHAARVLKILGVEDCFERVLDFETIMGADFHREGAPVVCKPQPLAFERALALAGVAADKALFADDSRRNVKAAGGLGIFTVHVGGAADAEVPEGAAAAVQCIKQLVDAVPELRP
eukprot:PRCOL_00001927-RA